MRLVLDCQWDGHVFIKSVRNRGSAVAAIITGSASSALHHASISNSSSSGNGNLSSSVAAAASSSMDQWDARYLVMQGHRLLWWGSEEDVCGDKGNKPPLGELLLQGHAGISPPSIVDRNEVVAQGRDVALLVGVFGRDVYANTQEKRSILCQDEVSCRKLIREVNRSVGVVEEEEEDNES